MTHTASRRPHPILKRDSSPFKAPALLFTSRGSAPFSPHVHFPPTPRIAATYPAHSPTTYDRKPIVVSPNVVQLPQRGARKLTSPSADFDCEPRGRGRSLTRGRASDRVVKGSYFHPRAYEACNPEPSSSAASSSFDLPSLIQDLSPSDESDDIITPPGGDVGSPGPGHHASIGHAISLHLPGAQKPRYPSVLELQQADSPLLRSALQSPPLRSNPHRKTRPNHTRNERRLSGRSSSGSFSPDLDEGCLGGF